MNYSTENIRTVALLGHGSAGKTTLVEALLAKTGAIPAVGSVEKGTTVSDSDPLEKNFLHSLRTSVLHLDLPASRVHVLDTPGFPDFIGQAIGALDAVETAAVVVNAANGIEMITTRMMEWAKNRKLCRLIIVNKIDAENIDLPRLLDDLRSAFGREVLPINLPAAGGTRVVDCFFNPAGESDFSSVAEAHQALVLAHVFKVVNDPYVGKIGVFRVHQGRITKDTQLYVGVGGNEGKKPFKLAHPLLLQGKDTVEVTQLVPGDIGAIAKVDEVTFDCVLHDSHDEDYIRMQPLDFPKPMFGLAIEPKRRGDEGRISEVMAKLAAEDPTLVVEHDAQQNETVVRGLSDLHLRSVLERMNTQYKIEVSTRPPRVPYRETIGAGAEGHARHKKQTGGAGQFGEVFLRVEPLARGEGFEFVDQVKGGVIPFNLIPAVEKGVREVLASGFVAGYPLQDLRVVVYDGKHHPVDSKEVAFVSAGRKAMLDALEKRGRSCSSRSSTSRS
jgi:small GTP-binding protein